MRATRQVTASAAERFSSRIAAATIRGFVLTGFAAVVGVRVARGGRWRQRGRPSIPGPGLVFHLKITEPTAENTGPRVPPTQTFGSPGSPYTYTISMPGVTERIRVYGRINVTAESGVIIRDVEVIMQPSTTQINGIQFNAENSHGNLVEFTRVTVGDPGLATEEQSTCIRGRGVDVIRCDLSGAVDGLQVYTPTKAVARQRVRILGTYIHDLIVSPSTQSDGWTHNDCIQGLGSLDLEIIGNALHGGRTSCVIINTDVPAHGWGDCIVEDNWCYGDPLNGSTLNVATTASIGNLSVKRNRISRAGKNSGQCFVKAPNLVPTSCGAESGTSNGASTSDWVYGPDANVFMDNGAPVPIRVG